MREKVWGCARVGGRGLEEGFAVTGFCGVWVVGNVFGGWLMVVISDKGLMVGLTVRIWYFSRDGIFFYLSILIDTLSFRNLDWQHIAEPFRTVKMSAFTDCISYMESLPDLLIRLAYQSSMSGARLSNILNNVRYRLLVAFLVQCEPQTAASFNNLFSQQCCFLSYSASEN